VIAVTLIASVPPCDKCIATDAMMKRMIAKAEFQGKIQYRKLTIFDEEAEEYGVVMTPMLIADDVVLAVGKAPIESKLEELLGKLIAK